MNVYLQEAQTQALNLLAGFQQVHSVSSLKIHGITPVCTMVLAIFGMQIAYTIC